MVNVLSLGESDAALVELAKSGNSGAMDQLFHRYSTLLQRFVYPLVNSLDESEDVVQETFVSLYGNLHRIRDGQAFRKMLLVTANNIIKTRLRSRSRKPQISLESVGETTASKTMSPDQIVEDGVLASDLKAAITQLPKAFREVVLLRYASGLEVEAIANMLDIPDGTVKSRLGRGREMLRKRLKGWIGNDDAK